MYGYIYITTNLINDRKYIGQKTSRSFLGNKYLGSGKLIKQAIKKYGSDNFKVDLIEECETEDDLNKREIYWIAYYDAVNSPVFYNIAFGGNSPAHRLSDDERKRVSDQMRRLQVNGGYRKGKPHSDETKLKMSIAHKGITPQYKDRDAWRASVGRDVAGEKNPMYGKSHSSKSKSIMSQKRSFRNKGCIWINNGIVEKFVKNLDEIEDLLSQGFTYGRLYRPRHRRKSSTTIESVGSEKDTTE